MVVVVVGGVVGVAAVVVDGSGLRMPWRRRWPARWMRPSSATWARDVSESDEFVREKGRIWSGDVEVEVAGELDL